MSQNQKPQPQPQTDAAAYDDGPMDLGVLTVPDGE